MTTSVDPFTCITVQSYPSLGLVQSPQVFHLHVFPGHMYHVNGTTLVVIGPNQN
jgi:hypothetical protein